jgi:UDP-glucose 4-epimerase
MSQQAKIYVAGHRGMVGSAIVRRLQKGAVIASRPFVIASEARQSTPPAIIITRTHAELDLTNQAAVQAFFKQEKPSQVYLAAAKVGGIHANNTYPAADPLEEFRRVNVQGTLNLARQAAAAGVRRFVFVSSIKVNGEATQLGQPFTADDAPAPLDAYGVSKMEAERGLREIARQTGMEVVIIRPPLVYGPGVKANFAAMMRWLKRGVPLPLGAIHNQRSLVSLDNLVDLLVTCITHPAAANQTFLVSDGADVSTTELLRRMGQALGRPARLMPVPVSWLKLAAAMVGKQDVAQRLCGSLQVDIEKTRRLLGWTPPLSLDQGLKRAAGNTG